LIAVQRRVHSFRCEPAAVRLDGWRHVHHLREARVVSDDEFEEMTAEDRVIARRAPGSRSPDTVSGG
jgi:hypothetical protein